MNAFVDTGAKAFADGSIVWGSNTIKAVLADATFTPTYDAAGNINNAQFLSTIAASVVGSAQTLASKSDTAGVLVAADLIFPSVSGNTVVRVWVYKDTGLAASSPLLFAYDTGSGFPIVPDGTNINLFWDSGAFRIAQI